MTDSARLSSKRVYAGRVFNVDLDRVRFPNGSEGELEMVRHPGASAVVPFLSDPAGEDPQILLIRQYRYAAEQFIYEVPAGRLEEGEDPVDCARRELKEETGCTAGSFERLFTMFTTPGFTDEKIHVFLAQDITRGESKLESDEFAEVVVMTLSEALVKIRAGEIQDGKTALSLMYVAGFRAGL